MTTEKRIIISGRSGAGKTTLAKYIASRYRIPFINGSSKVLWERYGIKNHKELIEKCDKDLEFAKNFQFELLSYRKEQINKYPEFVTDRGPLDNIVYYLLQVAAKETTVDTTTYIDLCFWDLPSFTQIYINMKGKETVIPDGKRVDNEWYQKTVDGIFRQYLASGILKNEVITIHDWEWEKRIKIIERHFSPNKWRFKGLGI